MESPETEIHKHLLMDSILRGFEKVINYSFLLLTSSYHPVAKIKNCRPPQNDLQQRILYHRVQMMIPSVKMNFDPGVEEAIDE